MLRNRKNIALFLLTGALISMIILAASLSNLQLQDGRPFPEVSNSENILEFYPTSSRAEIDVDPIMRSVVAFSLLLIMIYVAGRLIAFLRIKQILYVLLVVGILLFVVSLLPGVFHRKDAPSFIEYVDIPAVSSVEVMTTPLGQPPQELIWILTIFVVLVMALLGINMLRRWLNPVKEEGDFLDGAQIAVNDLKAGMDLKNVILRCYLQMAHALQEEHGLERSDHMTTQEFEAWLQTKGVPPIPVHQLTVLFEKVRYSNYELNGKDESLAMDSLNEIVRYCRKVDD